MKVNFGSVIITMFGINVASDDFVGVMSGAQLLLGGDCRLLRMKQGRCRSGGCLVWSGHGSSEKNTKERLYCNKVESLCYELELLETIFIHIKIFYKREKKEKSMKETNVLVRRKEFVCGACWI